MRHNNIFNYLFFSGCNISVALCNIRLPSMVHKLEFFASNAVTHLSYKPQQRLWLITLVH